MGTIQTARRIEWRQGPDRLRPLPFAKRPLVALWIRTAAVTALLAAGGFLAIGSAPKAELAKAATDEPAPAPESTKVAVRLDGAETPKPAPAVETKADPVLGPAIAPTRFAGAPVAAAPGFVPHAPVWTERDFAHTTVADGRTLAAEGIRIRLVGLDLPLPEQVCRTLDGRLEPCVVRAATQLELLTRGRPVSCVYRMTGPSDAMGRCRIGFSDLTERMIRTGYAWPTADMPTRSST